MLVLEKKVVTLQQEAADKTAAIKAIATQLADQGLVSDQYSEGMLERENQNSTFLGNGIAIPHGTTKTRDLVSQTGVAIHHFPNGVDWGDGNTVYVAIGIAAKSDEHLGILKQLTQVLSADGVEQKLKQAKNEEDIIALLSGHVQFNADFDAALIQLNFPASDMLQMTAVAGGLLKNQGKVQNECVAALVTKTPTYLGDGLWLVSSDQSVDRSAMSIVTTSTPCEYIETTTKKSYPVKGLIAMVSCNSSHQNLLNKITELVFNQQQKTLLSSSVDELLVMFASVEENSAVNTDNHAIYKIKNAHGLHARPGAMLVAEAKKYQSKITVSHANGDEKPVNAKSLMKVIALGVKKGDELKFMAEGDDAEAALTGIGEAINSGLGEA